MLLTLSIFPLLQAQSTRLKAKLSEVDRQLGARYGDRYFQVKQQLDGTKIWYEKTRAEAKRTGTIPLDQKTQAATGEFAKAGSAAAQKERVIKQQLQDLWQSIKNR